ncbi:MAG: gamma-glutamyl-gamma-aminobutyrate hydrolase family protein [Solirubrobacteraceae bacterium]
MSRPAIGVTASLETMRSGAWVELTAGTPFAYCQAIQRAGGRAVILVPDPADSAAPEAVIATLQGLIVTGSSSDLDPALYGAPAHEATDPVPPVRDEFDVALTRAALAAGLPLLGVCRGMQVLNVACGGTLEQHLPDAVGHGDHQGPPGTFAEHPVRLEPGSLAAAAAGAEQAEVKSYHHQGLARLGAGLRATGWSGLDGIVEAVERPGGFVLGVLWHPEEDPASPVIPALVAAAGGGADRRAGPVRPRSH